MDSFIGGPMWGRVRKQQSNEELNPSTGGFERPTTRNPPEDFNSTRRGFDEMDRSFGKPKKNPFL